MNKEKLRENFRGYCNVDNFSAPPYETDIIADYWLNIIEKRDRELIEKIMIMRAKPIEKKPENTEKDRIYNVLNKNMVDGYNLAIEDIINLIKKYE